MKTLFLLLILMCSVVLTQAALYINLQNIRREHELRKELDALERQAFEDIINLQRAIAEMEEREDSPANQK